MRGNLLIPNLIRAIQEEKKQSLVVKEKIEEAEKQKAELTHLRDSKLNLIGNLVYSDVPISQSEEQNAVVSTWG
jgi:seryl-tRNA synthetase